MCVGREKCGISKDEFRRGGWHFFVICGWCARACVVEQGREISILSQLRTELRCGGHITSVSSGNGRVGVSGFGKVSGSCAVCYGG